MYLLPCTLCYFCRFDYIINTTGSKWEHRKSLPIMPLGHHTMSHEAIITSSSSTSNATTSSGSSFNNNNICASAPPLLDLAPRGIKDPQEFFRKSCSMKIAAEEAVEAGDEAEEEEDDDEDKESKKSRLKGARGDWNFFGEHFWILCVIPVTFDVQVTLFVSRFIYFSTWCLISSVAYMFSMLLFPGHLY